MARGTINSLKKSLKRKVDEQKKLDRRDKRGDIKKADIVRLTKHFAQAFSGVRATRVSTKSYPTSWTAIYRISFDGASWEEIRLILDQIGKDKKLVKSVGASRGSQIVAYYERDPASLSAKMRKKFKGKTDAASLSAAERFDVSLSHASSVAEEWTERYEDATVQTVLFYFR